MKCYECYFILKENDLHFLPNGKLASGKPLHFLNLLFEICETCWTMQIHYKLYDWTWLIYIYISNFLKKMFLCYNNHKVVLNDSTLNRRLSSWWLRWMEFVRCMEFCWPSQVMWLFLLTLSTLFFTERAWRGVKLLEGHKDAWHLLCHRSLCLQSTANSVE